MIVGNTLVGSWLLLRQILQGWRVDAEIALAPVKTWIEALKTDFNLSYSTERVEIAEILSRLEAVIAEIDYQPEDLIAGLGIANYWIHDRTWVFTKPF